MCHFILLTTVQPSAQPSAEVKRPGMRLHLCMLEALCSRQLSLSMVHQRTGIRCSSSFTSDAGQLTRASANAVEQAGIGVLSDGVTLPTAEAEISMNVMIMSEFLSEKECN